MYDRIKAGVEPNQPTYDVAHMVSYAGHMIHHHDTLFELQKDGGESAFAFELEDRIVVLQPAASGRSNHTTERLASLNDLAIDMYAAVERLAQLPVEEMNEVNSVQMRFLALNYATFRDSMLHSQALRNQDLVEMMPRVQLELIIAGCVAFSLCVLVAMPIFYLAVRNVSERTQAVTMLLLHIPRRLAKTLRDRSQAGLERLLAATDDAEAAMDLIGVEGLGGNGQQGGMLMGQRGVGLQDEEREKQMFVQQQDEDEEYRAVLRAAEKQVNRRMAAHAAGKQHNGRGALEWKHSERKSVSGHVHFVELGQMDDHKGDGAGSADATGAEHHAKPEDEAVRHAHHLS